MKYLPIEDITYETRLDRKEIKKRISEIIKDENKVFDLSKKYTGEVGLYDFNFKQRLNSRNAFHPLIRGEIKEANSGTVIKVKIRLKHTDILLLLILGFPLSFLAILNLTTVLTFTNYNFYLFVPYLGLLFLYAISMLVFKTASSEIKVELKKLFEAEIVSE